MVRFSGRYTEKQWRQGVWMATRPRGVTAVLYGGLFLIGLALAVAVVHSMIKEGQVGFREGRRLLSAFLAIYLGARPYIHLWRSAQKGWQQVRSISMTGTVDAEGILLFDQVRRTWDNFIRLYVGKNLAVLVEQTGHLLVLPKSFFTSEDDWESFLQTARMAIAEPK